MSEPTESDLVEAMRDDLAQTRQAFLEFAQHKRDCNWHRRKKCTCGLEELAAHLGFPGAGQMEMGGLA